MTELGTVELEKIRLLNSIDSIYLRMVLSICVVFNIFLLKNRFKNQIQIISNECPKGRRNLITKNKDLRVQADAMIKKSFRAFNAAGIFFKYNDFDEAFSKAYYAAFHILQAILSTNTLSLCLRQFLTNKGRGCRLLKLVPIQNVYHESATV